MNFKKLLNNFVGLAKTTAAFNTFFGFFFAINLIGGSAYLFYLNDPATGTDTAFFGIVNIFVSLFVLCVSLVGMLNKEK